MDLDLDLDALQLLAGESAQLIIEQDKGCTVTCMDSCRSTCAASCLNTG
ncbi:hypothetical protein SAMN05421541_10147 [Actinoplanes philippinensis]|uniref:Uncharacterized protein n=1 Tax=Actinoplanes philippinensis TaxID=35752 RepID=A0A1I1ZDL7_9ACTN|nr:hypothetical protein [Actinoplanes philippinensis]SFE29826.1 hypothetical protein SAMN05421541_10147 [Actinoplanes philippinensis]